MNQFGCYCPHCHLEFADDLGIRMGGGATLKLVNNRVTCPRCGKIARVADAQFEAVDGKLLFVDGPRATKELLGRLGVLVERVKAEDVTAQEVLAEIAEISPELADKLGAKFGGSTFALILLLLWLLKACQLNVTVDVNRLIDQVGGVDQTTVDAPELVPLPPELQLDPPPTTIAAAPESRQVRRQRERQARKAQQRNDRRA